MDWTHGLKVGRTFASHIRWDNLYQLLSLKANTISTCQSCCKEYGGNSSTFGLVVSRSEQKLVSSSWETQVTHTSRLCLVRAD